jgi:phage gp46-like protein
MAKNYFDFRYNFATQDWVKNVANDIAGIDGDNAIIQILMTRLLIPKGQYILNPSIGSNLYTLVNKKATSVTDSVIREMIDEALKTEFDNNNIDSLEVTTSITDDKIEIAVKVGITDSDPVNINLTLNL